MLYLSHQFIPQPQTRSLMTTEETLDELNTQVSAAITEAQLAEERVSVLEEKIANLTEPNSVEGGIARRGAVSAALKSGNEERARELANRFLAEGGLDQNTRDTFLDVIF